ncbi:MAG: preprotein translocase subunit YajC [Bacillota bacterium]|nr:preprotein translocase subunit YajC [Bacillota bacterium]
MDSVLWGRTISLGAMFFVFYVLVLRPQRQEMLRQRKIVNELKKGDQIITTGGLVGTVASFKGEHFVSIRVAEGVEILLRKDGIDALMPSELR